jgi:dimethylargininase
VSHFTLEVMDEPATMDGGDIFIMGGVVYAGRSGRTNDHGLAQLETLARRQGLDMVVVDVLDGLHLKSAVRPIGPETVVVTQGAVDESRMPGLRKVAEAIGERFLFSALPLGPRLLATASSPKTNEAVAGLGFEVDAIDVSEILAADGGLTCMSIIF